MLFLLYIYDLPNEVISNIALYADTIFCSRCGWSSDLWQQLGFTFELESEFAFELESNIQDTVDWYRTWLLDFNAGKTHLKNYL